MDVVVSEAQYIRTYNGRAVGDCSRGFTVLEVLIKLKCPVERLVPMSLYVPLSRTTCTIREYPVLLCHPILS